MTVLDQVKELYKDHDQLPYISPDRDLEAWLALPKLVPKRNMEALEDGLLAGDIILLWRVGFDTFHNQSSFPKYFEYTYGIDGQKNLENLVAKGYVLEESAFDSLDHLSAPIKKNLLKQKGVVGLSKMKADQVDQALHQYFTEEDLATCFAIRGYVLTDKGAAMLAAHPEIIDRHPQKKF